MKTKTITLEPGFRSFDMPPNTQGYRVGRVTDSLEFSPGDIISKEKAQELCDLADWKVTVANQK